MHTWYIVSLCTRMHAAQPFFFVYVCMRMYVFAYINSFVIYSILLYAAQPFLCVVIYLISYYHIFIHRYKALLIQISWYWTCIHTSLQSVIHSPLQALFIHRYKALFIHRYKALFILLVLNNISYVTYVQTHPFHHYSFKHIFLTPHIQTHLSVSIHLNTS